jgi:hypothetical protein
MKAVRSVFIGAASVLLATTTAVAAPLAHISCVPSGTPTNPTGAQPINSSDITSNVSYFDIGLAPTLNISGTSSGAGSGKVTFPTAEFHISLSKFAEFIGAETFEKCTIDTTLADGNSVQYTLTLVALQSIAAIAQSPHNPTDTPAAYADLVLQFGGVSVKTTGSDDGGTSGSDGGSTPKN